MYKHSHQSIQDLLSLHSVFQGFTATDGQLSQLKLTISGRPGCTCYINESVQLKTLVKLKMLGHIRASQNMF